MKKNFRSLTALAIFFLLFSLAAGITGDREAAVDKLFSNWNKPDSPGCALAVVDNGEIIYKKGYGMANLELGIPLSPESVFYIGSCSKQFVTMSIAVLVQKEKLSLDDDIRKHIPEMPDYGIPITVRHLIHHTSGLRDYLTLEAIAGVDFGTFHEDDVLELIARQKALNFNPGEEYLYSNSGYFLLSVIVERVSGMSQRVFAEKNIFKPLGMQNSRFHDDYTELIPNRATGYFPAGKGTFKNFVSTFDCVGSGGLYTSVEDLFLWDQNFVHHKVGGREVFDLLHTRGRLNSGQELDYAFAISHGEYKGLKTVSHGGALGGYRSFMVRFPEQDFSVICLANLSSFNPAKLSYQVADIYLADKLMPDKPTPEKSKTILKTTQIPESKLREKAGPYMDHRTGEVLTITYSEGKLSIEASGQTFLLAAFSEMDFEVVGTLQAVKIRFEKPAKDKSLLIHVLPEGESPETYEAFTPVSPGPDDLRLYAGLYRSDELQTTFRLEFKEGKLYFTHRNAPKSPLKPTLKDRSVVQAFKIQFIRDPDNTITAFTLDAGRVKNLRFERQK